MKPWTEREKVMPAMRPFVDWLEIAGEFRCVIATTPKAMPALDVLEAARRVVLERPELAAHALALATILHPLTRSRFPTVVPAVFCEREACEVCAAAAVPSMPSPMRRGRGARAAHWVAQHCVDVERRLHRVPILGWLVLGVALALALGGVA